MLLLSRLFVPSNAFVTLQDPCPYNVFKHNVLTGLYNFSDTNLNIPYINNNVNPF